MKRILYIRNFAKAINLEQYNSQEIGLCKNFIDRGYDCDIIYYTKDKEEVKVIYVKEGRTLRIKTKKALKVFSNAIYLKTLLSLRNYDIVISSEFHQVMSMLIPLIKRNNIYIYHGTYQDENRLIGYIPRFVIRWMNRYYKMIFTKSVLAEKYLQDKGFDRIKVVGVGLDTSKFENDRNKSIPNNVNNKYGRYLLYVGEFCERKNTLFLLDVMANLQDKEVKLLLIGKSKDEYKEKLDARIKELHIEKRVVFIGSVTQNDLFTYYEGAEIFLLPSNYEIFGMVLLECMYFNTPILSSKNGGSMTLFGSDNQDLIIPQITISAWVDRIDQMLKEDKADIINRFVELYSKGLDINNWRYISDIIVEHLR